MRAGLLALIAVAILAAPQARAYQAATSGVEIVVSPLGGNLWEMTLESDRALTSGVFDLDQGSASMAYTTAAPCDGVVAICSSLDQSVTSLPSLIFSFAIIVPKDPSLLTGSGNPVVLGQLTTTGPLSTGVNPPEWGTSFALTYGLGWGFNGGSAPLTFVVVAPAAIPAAGVWAAALLAALVVGAVAVFVIRMRTRSVQVQSPSDGR